MIVATLLRIPARAAITLPLLALAATRAVGAALLLLGAAAAAMLRMLLRSDRFTRRQMVEAMVRGCVLPLPLVGALSGLLGATVALAIGSAFAVGRIEGVLLPVIRQALMRHAVPLLIGLLVLGQSGLGLATRLVAMQTSGEADTLRSLGIPPAEWVLPAALLEFLMLAATQYVCGVGVAQLAAAVVLQAQHGLPAAHYADMLAGPAARADFWCGMARCLAASGFAWMVAATTAVSSLPTPDRQARATRTTFIVTLLGLLVLAAAFTWAGA